VLTGVLRAECVATEADRVTREPVVALHSRDPYAQAAFVFGWLAALRANSIVDVRADCDITFDKNHKLDCVFR